MKATTAYAPLQRECTPVTAPKIVSRFSRRPDARTCSSCASTFSNTSESELVLTWRKSERNSDSFSSRVLQIGCESAQAPIGDRASYGLSSEPNKEHPIDRIRRDHGAGECPDEKVPQPAMRSHTGRHCPHASVPKAMQSHV